MVAEPILQKEVSSFKLLQPDPVHIGALRKFEGGLWSTLNLAVVGASVAITGAAVASLTAAGLYASDWDFRPQDRSAVHWKLIVESGTAGLVIAGSTVAVGAVVVGLACLRGLSERSLAPLVGPLVSVFVAGAVAALAMFYVVQAIQHFEVLSTRAGLF